MQEERPRTHKHDLLQCTGPLVQIVQCTLTPAPVQHFKHGLFPSPSLTRDCNFPHAKLCFYPRVTAQTKHSRMCRSAREHFRGVPIAPEFASQYIFKILTTRTHEEPGWIRARKVHLGQRPEPQAVDQDTPKKAHKGGTKAAAISATVGGGSNRSAELGHLWTGKQGT